MALKIQFFKSDLFLSGSKKNDANSIKWLIRGLCESFVLIIHHVTIIDYWSCDIFHHMTVTWPSLEHHVTLIMWLFVVILIRNHFSSLRSFVTWVVTFALCNIRTGLRDQTSVLILSRSNVDMRQTRFKPFTHFTRIYVRMFQN